MPSPTLLLPDEAQSATLANARQAMIAAERECEKLTMDQPAQEIADQLIHLDFNTPIDKEVGHPSKDDRNVAAATGIVTLEGENKAVVLDGDIGFTLKNIEPFDRWTPFTVDIRYIENERVPQRAVIAHHTRGTDAGYNGWDLTIENGCVESRLYRVWPGNAIGVRTTGPVPAQKWQHLTATYDGSSRAAGLKLYLDGELLETTILRDEMVKSRQRGGRSRRQFCARPAFPRPRLCAFAGGRSAHLRPRSFAGRSAASCRAKGGTPRVLRRRPARPGNA